jgi:hypothetical protein
MKEKIFLVLLFMTIPIMSYGEIPDAETRRLFEVRYKIWNDEYNRIKEFLTFRSGESMKEFKEGIVGMGVKILPILIERMYQDDRLIYAVIDVSGWRLIPGEMQLRSQRGISWEDYYAQWWKAGQSGVKKLFEDRYKQWKEVKPTSKKDADQALINIRSLGVACLPYLFEKIENNETIFLPLVASLTQNIVRSDMTASESINWWKKNKNDWLIPFPDQNLYDR